MLGVIIVLALLCLVLGMALCFLMLGLDDIRDRLELYNMHRPESDRQEKA